MSSLNFIIVAELEFCNVQWHVSFADFVECAHNAPLDDRPEALNRVRVNSANHVFLARMVDGGVGEFVSSNGQSTQDEALFHGDISDARGEEPAFGGRLEPQGRACGPITAKRWPALPPKAASR